LVLVCPRQPEDHHRQHERVVRAEKSLEDDEQADGEEVGRVDRHQRRARLDMGCIKAYIWIDARFPPGGHLASRRHGPRRTARTSWQSNTISTLSAWPRACWTCTRRRSASTNVSGWFGQRARSGACGSTPLTSWNGCG